MDISSIIFLFIGILSLILGFVLEGGSIGGLLEPTAALIVFGGTLGAVGVSFPMKEIKRIPKMIAVIFKKQNQDLVQTLEEFKYIAGEVRKNGLLQLEEVINNKDMDPFMKKGLQMAIDGVEPEVIKECLEVEATMISQRHRAGAKIFDSAGGYAPTLGIIGTVLGLIHVLGSMNDTSTLGSKIAVAFVATLYGVFSANILWMPIGSRLKNLDSDELKRNSMIIDGVLAVQEGRSPQAITNKLIGYIDKNYVNKFTNIEGQGD
ncbi:hypothetical protein CM240_1619 [Clostridium bornimense]|uniref:Uncharacterized protein n=1 Tax=Clostridium bornimense TaxID=1216932 RepID=W6S384_9CLOT|nr:flagellar motor protein [Clostridium bornimense]CDM68777.1 hypothetical protein CM240_1619 [Clostridium bornimense]